MESIECKACEYPVSIKDCDLDCEISGDKVEINALCPYCSEPLWFASKQLSDFSEEK